MKLAFASRVSPAFARAVIAMCGRLWPTDVTNMANNVMGCMGFESGGTFSPNIRNAAGSGATGLIQFMPSTARDLGTTTDALANMSAIEQLVYVEKYFRPYASRMRSLSDTYMAILLPSAIGKPEDAALFTGGTVAYRQNSGLDANNDGKVTKAEASAKVAAKLAQGLSPGYVGDVS